MPTYEFRCPRGHRFDKFSSRMSSQPSAKCPTCGKRARRLISGGAGLVFKGSGFYITDYKRKGEKQTDASGSDAKSTESKAGESKSGESKSGESKSGESKPAESKSKPKS